MAACDRWQEPDGSELSRCRVMTGQEQVQHIYPVFSSSRKSPTGWEVAPGPKSPQAPRCCPGAPIPCHSSGGSTGVTLLGAAKVTPGCLEGQSCQQVTVPAVLITDRSPGALEGSEQDREHFTAAFQQSSEGSLARIWVTEGAAAAPPHCKPTAGALCCSAPGQDGPWTQAGSPPLLPGEGRMGAA